MAVDVIVGLQRGDEGKGRFTDMLMENYEIGARYNGGPNAGHTVITPEGQELRLHTIPSGIGYEDKKCVIGDGVFVDAIKLCAEIDDLRERGVKVSPDNLLISSSAHLILPHHILEDEKREAGSGRQGSTKSGIAQVDADLALRQGMRAEVINNDPDALAKAIYKGLIRDGGLRRQMREGRPGRQDRLTAELYVEQALRLGSYITDTMLFLNKALERREDILAEGAQAFLLDKYQGMWPYTTSSITTAGGVSPGLGVPPQSIDRVVGVAKAIHSHVGDGHFVTEVSDDELRTRLHGNMEAGDAEKGTTTNRVRRLGHLDLPQLRRAVMANGITDMAITKLDWVSRYGDTIPVCVSYKRKGHILEVAPNAEYKLQQSEPIYAELPGWNEDISTAREFSDLPTEAQDYVKFVEEKANVVVGMVGVGPRRDEVIVREDLKFSVK